MTRDNHEELLEEVREIFTDRIPFNRALGIAVENLEDRTAVLAIRMRKNLVGNYVRGTLHGGVISSILDAAGGLAAFLGVLHRLRGQPLEKKIDRFSRLGTIDLRVDYLRPGLGRRFRATSSILRTGSRVAVSSMELRNDTGDIIAVGTGAYIIA